MKWQPCKTLPWSPWGRCAVWRVVPEGGEPVVCARMSHFFMLIILFCWWSFRSHFAAPFTDSDGKNLLERNGKGSRLWWSNSWNITWCRELSCPACDSIVLVMDGIIPGLSIDNSILLHENSQEWIPLLSAPSDVFDNEEWLLRRAWHLTSKYHTHCIRDSIRVAEVTAWGGSHQPAVNVLGLWCGHGPLGYTLHTVPRSFPPELVLFRLQDNCLCILLSFIEAIFVRVFFF